MRRSAQSLLFGPRRAPQLRLLSSLSEERARHLVHLRGAEWAEQQANQFRSVGDQWSAALLRAALLVSDRCEQPVLCPTGEWILHKFTSGENHQRARLTLRRTMYDGSGPELLAYLFPSMPGQKTAERFIKLIDNKPETTILSLATRLLVEGCPEDDLYGEVSRRRSLHAFQRRSDDLERIENWMTKRPDYLPRPHWWHIVCQTAFSHQVDRSVLAADLSNPDLAAALASQLGSDDIGIASMLSNKFNLR